MRYDDDADVVYQELDYRKILLMSDVMIAWRMDAYRAAIKLGYPQAGNIWGMKTPITNRWVLDLTEDQLMLVDRRVVAPLPWRSRNFRSRKFVFIQTSYGEPQRIRAMRMGISRRTYDRWWKEFLLYAFDALCPEIEIWPQWLARREAEVVPDVE